MNILISAIISLVIPALALFGFYNYATLDTLDSFTITGNRLGTVTTGLDTVTGSTLVSDLDDIIPALITALDEGKIDAATTTIPFVTSMPALTTASALTSVGTIGTGIWNGTAITAANGGTGSTTLASNMVLLGNGTGILKTVSGFGSSGQFLTSGGADTPPTWTTSSINLGGSYVWTGPHHFSYSALFSQPINLNTVSYTFPSATGTANSVLTDANGNGTLSWGSNGNRLLKKLAFTASTTPGWNFGTGYTFLRFVIIFSLSADTSTTWQFNEDTGSNYARREEVSGAADGTAVSQTSHQFHGNQNCNAQKCVIVIDCINEAATAKYCTASVDQLTAVSTAPEKSIWVGTWANTSVQMESIKFTVGGGNNATGNLYIYGTPD